MHNTEHGAAAWRAPVASPHARNAAAHPDRSATTRILHLGLLLIVLHQLIGSEFMQRPFPGEAPGTVWLLHEWVGLAGFGVVAAFWVWTLVRRGETALGRLFPWFSASGIAAVFADLVGQLRRALRGQLPDDEGGAMTTAIHGGGLLAVTVMAVTGTVYFFIEGHTGARFVLDVHKTRSQSRLGLLVSACRNGGAAPFARQRHPLAHVFADATPAYRAQAAAALRRSTKSDPPPSRGSIQAAPPCAAAISATIASPSPAPPPRPLRAAMEAREDAGPLRLGHAGATVPDQQHRRRRDLHRHGAAGRCMAHGIIEQVTQRERDRRLVARHRCGGSAVAQRQLNAARYRKRREFGDHRHRDPMQIDMSGEIERYLLKPSHREHLPDEPRHAVGVVPEFDGLGLIGKFVDPRRQHREGRAECMRRVADEAALRVERLFEPAERRIHSADQRQDLSWQAFRGQPYPGLPRADQRCGRGSVPKWTQPVPDRQHPDQHGCGADRQQQPERAQQEVAHEAAQQTLVLFARLPNCHTPRVGRDHHADEPFRKPG